VIDLRTTSRSAGTGALALVAALALTGCGDSDDSATVETTAEAPASSSTTVPTTAPPTSTTATTAPPSTTAAVAFPPALEDLEHGGPVWAVVLAAAETSDHPDLAAAEAAAADAGYQAGPTDCDDGAAEALGHGGDGYWLTVSVYFETSDDAQEAAQAFAANGYPGAAVAEVRTFCLD
jgi:hypothetical protein